MSKINQQPIYLVIGPESSGTRLLTRVLIAGGCEGSAEHVQPFDAVADLSTLPAGRLVWRRSIPHCGDWDIRAWVLNILALPRITIPVLITRDRYCTARSQVHNGHAPTLEQAYVNVIRAWQEFFALTPTILSHPHVGGFVHVSYESLILSELAQRGLCRDLGLSFPSPAVQVTNENMKWWCS